MEFCIFVFQCFTQHSSITTNRMINYHVSKNSITSYCWANFNDCISKSFLLSPFPMTNIIKYVYNDYIYLLSCCEWMENIYCPQKALGNSICPYAKKTGWAHCTILSLRINGSVLIKKSGSVFLLFQNQFQKQDWFNYCKKLRELYRIMFGLPDHKTANTKIAGYSTEAENII